MSAITHLMGRVTRDPVVQKAKNTGTEYISLDLAVSQRSQNNQNGQTPYETVYYQCFFNNYLTERIQKADIKKGTCLYVYGELELHPFVYQQGQKAGQAGINAKVNVKDWQFCLANKPENASAPGMNQNGNTMPNNGGAATPGGGGYQNQGPADGNYAGANGTPNNNGFAGAGMANNGYNAGSGVPNNGYNAPPAPQTPPASYAGNAAQPYGTMPAGSYPTNGFANVPEQQAGQLPFN